MDSGVVDSTISFLPESIKHVVPVVHVVAMSGVLARVPGCLIAEEICNFLATLAIVNLGCDKTIRCLLKEKVSMDKRKGRLALALDQSP
jgi:hypothetical protein